MKMRLALVLLLFSPVVAVSQELALISFDDLPKLIREKNEKVQAAQSLTSAQESRAKGVLRSFLPEISAQIGTEEFKIGSNPEDRKGYWNIESRLNLFRGGRDSLETEIRNNELQYSRAEHVREYSEELKVARQVYWRLVATNLILADKQDALKKNEANIKSSRRRAGAGVATGADSVRFELHTSELSRDIKRLTLDRDLLRNQLSVVIGSNNHENIQVASEIPAPLTADLEFPALDPDQQIQIKALDSQVAVEESKHKQASRWWAPSVDLYAGYGLPSLSDARDRAMRDETEFVAGIRLGMHLDQGLSQSSEASAKFFEAQAAKKRSQYAKRKIAATDHELRHDLKLLRELIADIESDLKRSEQFLKLTETEYSRGVKNGPDLLDAFQRLYEMREKKIEYFKEYNEAKAELLALTAKTE